MKPVLPRRKSWRMIQLPVIPAHGNEYEPFLQELYRLFKVFELYKLIDGHESISILVRCSNGQGYFTDDSFGDPEINRGLQPDDPERGMWLVRFLRCHANDRDSRQAPPPLDLYANDFRDRGGRRVISTVRQLIRHIEGHVKNPVIQPGIKRALHALK